MKKIWFYIATTFLLSWFIAFALISGNGLESRWATVLVMVMSFMPALANAVTRIASNEGFKGTGAAHMYLRPTRTGRHTLRLYAGAWLLPIAATLLGAALYFILHPSLFDVHMNHYASMLQEAYAALGRTYTDAEMHSALRSELLLRLLFYPCLNFIMCLAAELGWRGYLLPHLLEKYSRPAAVLITGVLWGLWYGPLIEMGQYYGTGYAGYPYTGMLLIILICTVLGCFYSWLTLETGSVLAAALASAVFTSINNLPYFFCASDTYNPLLGPAPVGLIGAVGFIAIGAWCFVQLTKKNKTAQ